MRSLSLAVLATVIGGAYAFPDLHVKARSIPQARRRLGGDHGGEKPICGCEAVEDDHPFNMDCSDVAAVDNAEMYLKEHCPLANMSNSWYEWAGIFSVPDDLYRWSAQPVGNPLEYADPEMQTMFIPLSDRRRLAHPGHEDHWESIIPEAVWTGNCIEVRQGDTITPTEHVCYKMIFHATEDTLFKVDTTGTNEIAVFTGHGPLEFERDMHYFINALSEDIEPEAELPKQSTCGVESEDGVKKCQQAFFTIQAHHDYCLPGTITEAQSTLMHDYEDYCVSCAVNRQFIEGAEVCVKPLDCKSDGVAHAALAYLNHSCPILGGPGTCCNNPTEIAEYDILYAYHEFCGTDMSEELEKGMHNHEDACGPYICSTVTAPFDPMYCPPPEMTWDEEARANGWAPCKTKTASTATSRRLSAIHKELSRMLSTTNEDD